jgi:hypothetical protein
MKRNSTTMFLLLLAILNISAQKKSFSYYLGSSGGYITPDQVPFWLRSNQFGSVPLDNASLSLTGALRKDYSHTKYKIFDWGAAVEGRANIGEKSNFILIEGYGKVRISIFEFRAGRSKEIMGLCDTSLSSGAFAVSGNALGIPKAEISIPEFYSLPVFGRLLAFKGNFSNGWIGEAPFNNLDDKILHVGTYIHQKSLYGRFGKPEWKLKFYGGFNHQVLWGNEKITYGDGFTLSPFKTFLYVITGKSYDNHIRLGDHVGSIDLGFEYQFKNVRLLLYRQNLYEAGALYYLANIRDGLNGFSLVNKAYNDSRFHWKKILIEIFYTKSQGGESWSVKRPSGAEDYYNNWQYVNGWSYNGVGIGNPFISAPKFIREGLPSDPFTYFINNRIVAFHFGFEGYLDEWNFILKTSYSLNYGEKKQFSAYLDVNRKLKHGVNIGFTGAFDAGELYYNSLGVLFNVSKSF